MLIEDWLVGVMVKSSLPPAVHGTSTSYCQDTGMPQFGSRQGNDFAIGQTVTFSCDPGFVLNDTAVLVCEQSSTIAMWNGTVPGCVGEISGHLENQSIRQSVTLCDNLKQKGEFFKEL